MSQQQVELIEKYEPNEEDIVEPPTAAELDQIFNQVKVQLLLDYFVTRKDFFAFKPPWDMAACPFDKTHTEKKGHAILAHISKSADPVQVHWVAKKSDGWTREAGWWRIGFYQLIDTKIIWAVIDFDGSSHKSPLADPLAAALAVRARLSEAGLNSYLEKSGSGTGFHLWIFFDRAGVDAARVRRILLTLIPSDIPLASGGVADPQNARGIEVFPKQGRIDPNGFGNMVWAPFWHDAKDGGNEFYQVDDTGNLTCYQPHSFDRVSAEQIDDLYQALALTAPVSQREVLRGAKLQPAQAEVLAALNRLSAERRSSYEPWLHVGMALHAFDAGDWGLNAWDEWSKANADKYQPDACSNKWSSFKSDADSTRNRFTINSLFRWSNSDDPGNYYLPGWAEDAGIKVTVPLRLNWRVRRRGSPATGKVIAIKDGENGAPRRVTVFFNKTGLVDFDEPELLPVELTDKNSVRITEDDQHSSESAESSDNADQENAAAGDADGFSWSGSKSDERPPTSVVAGFIAKKYANKLAWNTTGKLWLEYEALQAGIWSEVPTERVEQLVRSELTRLVLEGFSWDYLSGTVKMLRTDLSVHQWESRGNVIPLQNGILDLASMKLLEHSPDNRLLWCLPYDFRPAATCEPIEQWMLEMMQGDAKMVQLLIAYLKAVVTGRADMQRFLECVGPGGTGKSTLIRLATALVGQQNIFTTELKHLEANRFETAGIYGKQLIVITDSERYGGNVTVLKSLTGQDAIRFEKKFQQQQSGFTCQAMIIVAANEMIQSADYTSGLERRRITVRFNNQIPNEKQLDLIEFKDQKPVGRLAHYLPGLLNLVLSMPDARMIALLKDTLREVPGMVRMKQAALLETNSLAEWLDNNVIYKPEPRREEQLKAYVGIAKPNKDKEQNCSYVDHDIFLYPNYCEYALATHRKAISNVRFTTLVEDLCINQLKLAHVGRYKDRHGSHFTCLKLRTEDDQDDRPISGPLDPLPPTTPPQPPNSPPPSGKPVAGCDGLVMGQVIDSDEDDGCDGLLQNDKRLLETGDNNSYKATVGRSERNPSHPSSLSLSTIYTHHQPITNPSPEAQKLTFCSVNTALISEKRQLKDCLEMMKSRSIDDPIGIDTETTGLDPNTSRVRLVQLAIDGQTFVIDADKVDIKPLEQLFDGGRQIIFQNAKFDLKFLEPAGVRVPSGACIFDTMIAAQLLDAGDSEKRSHSLAALADRYLGIELKKEQQRSDWSGSLSAEQIDYAATDAAILLPLAEKIQEQLKLAGLEKIAEIEMRAIPAIAWMELTGTPIDVERWRARADADSQRAAELKQELNNLYGQEINWQSSQQVLAVLKTRGHQLDSTDEPALKPLAAQDPIIKLLLDYREAEKRAGTYGNAWLTKNVNEETGRVHPDFKQLGADTGRMSCNNPNMQNLPRSSEYRGCVKVDPEWAVIKADFSQIELRIAAVIAQDQAMLKAYQAGQDLHTLTASTVLKVPIDQVTKQQRQLAKALNFGLLYGMGAEGLQSYSQNNYGVKLTIEEATNHRNEFFKLYQGLKQWHRRQPQKTIDTRTLTGRRRRNVERFTWKVNTPVQGTGADGLKLAMARLYEHRDEAPTARLILTVHDEIVAECPKEDAAEVAEWLRRHMVAAMLEILDNKIPVEVETKIGMTWAGE